MPAHLTRIAFVALLATTAVLTIGGILFGALTSMRREFERHPALYRPREQMMKAMPLAVVSMYGGAFAATSIFAMGFPNGAGLNVGVPFGLMLGIFVVCGFVLHNHVNLQISTRLTVYQAIAYFIEWSFVGLLISLFYKG